MAQRYNSDKQHGTGRPFLQRKRTEQVLMRKEVEEPHMNQFFDSLVWLSALSLTPSFSIINHHKEKIEPIKRKQWEWREEEGGGREKESISVSCV